MPFWWSRRLQLLNLCCGGFFPACFHKTDIIENGALQNANFYILQRAHADLLAAVPLFWIDLRGVYRRCQLIYYDFYLLKKLERRQKVYSYNCSVSSDTRKANAKSKF